MKKEWKALIDGRDMDNGEIINAICESRGINDITEFLNPTVEDLIDPERLHNIEKAFDIIDGAIAVESKIVVWADTDVDGITAGTIMYRYLKNFTDNVEIIINDGKKHGVADKEIYIDTDLLIVVDSINKACEYDRFLRKSINVIVLDHHIPPDNIKEYDKITLVSSAVDYPNSQLSGAGVVWKFCRYCDELYLTDYSDNLVDLAATGIIADMCDLSVPENRFICKWGLSNIQNLALKKINGTYNFDSQAVSFGIAPLVNACNRLEQNEVALNAFISDDEDFVRESVKYMRSLKDQQNVIIDRLMPNIVSQAESQTDNKVMTFTIDVNEGVAGLLANKLMGVYQRPILVLKQDGDQYIGSARGCGIEDFRQVLIDCGAKAEGHELACGCFISIDELDAVRERLENALADVEYEDKRVVDIQLDIQQVNKPLIDNIKVLNFISGTGFKPITVMITGIIDYDVGDMSKGKHLKIAAGDTILLKWNYAGDFDEFDDTPFSVIGGLNNGYFGKTFYNQVIIDDYKIGE